MASFSRQGLCFNQGTDRLLKKKRIAAPAAEQLLERIKFGIPTQQHLQQVMGVVGRQRAHPNLTVVWPAAPDVLVSGTISDQ